MPIEPPAPPSKRPAILHGLGVLVALSGIGLYFWAGALHLGLALALLGVILIGAARLIGARRRSRGR